MIIHCTAIYENGVLRPKQPIALPEGTEVQLEVVPANSTGDHRTMADVLADIAAMPIEKDDQSFSGRDHDRVLYGEKGAR